MLISSRGISEKRTYQEKIIWVLRGREARLGNEIRVLERENADKYYLYQWLEAVIGNGQRNHCKWGS